MKDLSDPHNASKKPNAEPDFEQLMERYHQVHQGLQEGIQGSVQKNTWNRNWKSGYRLIKVFGGGAVLVVGAFWWHSSRKDVPAQRVQRTTFDQKKAARWIAAPPPRVMHLEKKQTKESQNLLESSRFLVGESRVNEESKKGTGTRIGAVKVSPEKKTTQERLQRKKKFKPNVFTKATPTRGLPALYAYLHQALRYPEEARQRKISGKVLTRFEIDAQGKVMKVSVLKGLGYGCDEEAIRIVQNMPRWHPATVNGKPITTSLKIPVVFNFKELEKKTSIGDTLKK